MKDDELVKKLENDIELQQRNVSYDTKEYTIELIVDKYLKEIEQNKNEFFVPDYQREFVWDNYRQSRFIESLLIGLPIPYIFLAETKDGRYEIVDGSQRIRTLAAFFKNELVINKLEVLTSLNGFSFCDMLPARQRKFRNISLKMIVLSEHTSDETKNEIFERINRGSDLLKDMEKRKGIYRGQFNDFIYTIAKNELFVKLTPIAKWFENRQEREELLLRFFAFYDVYPHFKDFVGISRQLDDYMEEENELFAKDVNRKLVKTQVFENMVEFVSIALKNGFSKNGSNQVSRVYFEAISVGVAQALKKNPKLDARRVNLKNVVKSDAFLKIISGKYHTHTPDKIIERIDFIRNSLLGYK